MTKLNEYRRVIGYSYLLYIVVIVPVSLIHELGHTAICSAGGYQFRIWLDFRGGHSICYGILGDNSVIAAMGGIFGLIASLGILAIWYFFSKTAHTFGSRRSGPCIGPRVKDYSGGLFAKTLFGGNV